MLHLVNAITLPFLGDVNLSGSILIVFFICLLAVVGFEFVNGFHDTANAVATVIYTKALKPVYAIPWSGTFNFLGVFLGGVAVAMGILKLLPLDDLMTQPISVGLRGTGSAAGVNHLEFGHMVSWYSMLQFPHAHWRNDWRKSRIYLAVSRWRRKLGQGKRNRFITHHFAGYRFWPCGGVDVVHHPCFKIKSIIAHPERRKRHTSNFNTLIADHYLYIGQLFPRQQRWAERCRVIDADPYCIFTC